jgi:hypothetical protein
MNWIQRLLEALSEWNEERKARRERRKDEIR